MLSFAKGNLNERIACYLLTAMRKAFANFTWGSSSFNENVLKAVVVLLPVVDIASHQLDLAYMESCIRELESARIRELEKWLVASGLDDYELKAAEQKALRDWQKGKIRTDCRKITDIFSVANAHCVLGEWVAGRRGGSPYVTASACNNSVSSYIDYKDEFKDRGNAIVIGGKTFVVTYQSEDFFSNDSHNLILRLKNEKYRIREVYLYLIGAINAGLSSQYSWGDSVSYKKIQKDQIVIPVTSTGEIDFDFMFLFVRATIKQTIRGVVEWKGREIVATKKAVAKPFGEMIQNSEAPEESDWEGRIAAFEETEK